MWRARSSLDDVAHLLPERGRVFPVWAAEVASAFGKIDRRLLRDTRQRLLQLPCDIPTRAYGIVRPDALACSRHRTCAHLCIASRCSRKHPRHESSALRRLSSAPPSPQRLRPGPPSAPPKSASHSARSSMRPAASSRDLFAALRVRSYPGPDVTKLPPYPTSGRAALPVLPIWRPASSRSSRASNTIHRQARARSGQWRFISLT